VNLSRVDVDLFLNLFLLPPQLINIPLKQPPARFGPIFSLFFYPAGVNTRAISGREGKEDSTA
jgi:hypothetical protein